MQKIIEMAKGMNLQVICEGVETEEQVDTLRELGCTVVQGYYYDKPLPMHEFLDKYCRKGSKEGIAEVESDVKNQAELSEIKEEPGEK